MRERLSRVLEYEKRLIQDRQQLLELLAQTDESDGELLRYKLECFQKEIAFMNRQVELLKEGARRRQREAETAMQQAPAEGAATQQAAAEGAATQQAATGGAATQQAAAGGAVIQQAAAGGAATQQAAAGGAAIQQAAVEGAATQQAATGGAATQQAPAGAAATQQASNQRIFTQETASPRGLTVRAGKAAENVKICQLQITSGDKKDLEKTIGKSLMGIFASVLIFISLILFATLLLPYFNDTAKMVTTYIVSFAFLGIGLLKLKKDKENKFYMALTGCGFGALYISLLLSNMYFKVLGDIPLYVLICIWGIGVCLFAKQQSLIFRIIGELGITISVLFGCVLCINNQDAVKMLALIIFYAVSSGVFYFVHYEKEFIGNLVHQISNVINVYALAACTLYIVGHGMNHLETWLMFAVVLVSIGSTLWHSLEKESISYGGFAAVYAYVGYKMLESMLVKPEIFSIAAYIVMTVLIVLYEWKKAGGVEGKYIVQTFLLFMSMTALMNSSDLYYYGMVPLLILPALLAGFFRKNFVFKYGSLVMLLIYTFGQQPYAIPHFLLEGAAIITAFVLLWRRKEQYCKVFKYALHVLTLLFLFNCTGDAVRELMAPHLDSEAIGGICNYILFTLFNIGMMKSMFRRNPVTGEQENPAVYNIANMLAMIVGVFMLGFINNSSVSIFWHIMLILTVLGAFIINAKNLLDKRHNLPAGIYVGIKFTILMIVTLESFDSVNYVVSISCLLLAIVSIVLGFVGQYKALRIFGLILSMISTFKLIMVDISYENTLGNALSFFVSGILCFVISLIYNYIDNRFRERA